MKKESMRKYSLLGLVLIGASAVAAAVVPSNKDKQPTGKLVNTLTPVGGAQLTCSRDAVSGIGCNWTETRPGGVVADRGAFSRTTVVNDTSTITIAGGSGAKVKTLTNNGGALNHTSFN